MMSLRNKKLTKANGDSMPRQPKVQVLLPKEEEEVELAAAADLIQMLLPKEEVEHHGGTDLLCRLSDAYH